MSISLYLLSFPLQPGSMGNYYLQVTVPPTAKICKLELEYKGDNFPCMVVTPELTPKLDDLHQTYAQYEDDTKPCGGAARFKLFNLQNWGGDPKTHPMEADLAPDANSIKVTAYLKVRLRIVREGCSIFKLPC